MLTKRLIIVIFYACGNVHKAGAQTVSGVFDSTFLPHQLHDTWEYKQSAGSQTWHFTVKVTGTALIEGQRCIVFTIKDPYTATESRQYYAFRNHTRVQYGGDISGEGSYSRNRPGIVLALLDSFPQSGWFTNSMHAAGTPDVMYDYSHYIFCRMPDTVFSPGKKGQRFHAVRLNFNQELAAAGTGAIALATAETDWYVKGIGLVKSDNYVNGRLQSGFVLLWAVINGHTVFNSH